jgi:hypothetical protein
MPSWTPTEARILAHMADGEPHLRDELRRLLPDELAAKGAFLKHVCLMRKKLEPLGETILCQVIGGRYYYRHVRLLRSHNRE